MKILVAIPTYDTVSTDCFKSVYDMDTSGHDVDLEFFTGHGVQRARNDIAIAAIQFNYDGMLMIDSDIIVPSDALRLLTQPFNGVVPDVCVGFYMNRHRPDRTVQTPENGNRRANYTLSITDKQLEKLDNKRILLEGTGLGCAFIKTSVFSKLGFPYFIWRETWDEVNQRRAEISEDMGFCFSVLDAGMKIWGDGRVVCKHVVKQVV